MFYALRDLVPSWLRFMNNQGKKFQTAKNVIVQPLRHNDTKE